jgi:hypothetical protein
MENQTIKKNKEEVGKYIHDIRNSKSFSIDILMNINNLPYEDRMRILVVYNQMISYYSSFIENEAK